MPAHVVSVPTWAGTWPGRAGPGHLARFGCGAVREAESERAANTHVHTTDYRGPPGGDTPVRRWPENSPL